MKKKINEKKKINKKNYNKFSGYKKKYALEKFFLEQEFKKMAKEGFKISIVRGFTFYGKHILNYNYLISKIISAIKLKKKIKINNPNTYRSYMHADDMCKWLIKIVDISSIKCPIINLGSDKVLNLEKIINFLNKKYNKNILIIKNKSKNWTFMYHLLIMLKKF